MRKVTLAGPLAVGVAVLAVSLFGLVNLTGRPGIRSEHLSRPIIGLDGTEIRRPDDIRFVLAQKRVGDPVEIRFGPDGGPAAVRDTIVPYYSQAPFPLPFALLGGFSFLAGFGVLLLKPADRRGRNHRLGDGRRPGPDAESPARDRGQLRLPPDPGPPALVRPELRPAPAAGPALPVLGGSPGLGRLPRRDVPRFPARALDRRLPPPPAGPQRLPALYRRHGRPGARRVRPGFSQIPILGGPGRDQMVFHRLGRRAGTLPHAQSAAPGLVPQAFALRRFRQRVLLPAADLHGH